MTAPTDTLLPTETHPLEPFLPENAKILLLGSFPPPRARWSMEFFYPNFNNDMWRIMGLVFFGDKDHFIINGQKCFDKESIASFCSHTGIALYDSATQIRRLSGNASDKFLDILTPTDITALLARLPMCRSIASTGMKSAEIISSQFGCPIPALGECSETIVLGKTINIYRMPSTSRAYPMSLEDKVKHYRNILEQFPDKIRLDLF